MLLKGRDGNALRNLRSNRRARNNQRLTLTSRGWSSLKLSAVSAGRVMSRLPVSPAPPVPAAAPMSPPMRAPFPPPASAPIPAPPAAPPPTRAAVLLPLPLLTWVASLVWISCSLPLISMLVKVNESTAPPLKRPAAFASFTVPVARAPFGITTLPSISTGSCTVALKACPGVLVFEPTVSSKTTLISVSAGTTTGLASGARLGSALFASDFPASAAGDVVSEVACWSADF